ncbi:Maf family protein [Myxococcota bacterium]|nr:Maf family protein [Myxococcota bacterium]
MTLTLASASPRRRQMLESLGYVLSVRPSDIDETPRPGEEPAAYAQRLAREKVAGAPSPAVAADTVVHLDGKIFGKPVDAEDAARMLGALSGREHLVTSAFALRVGDAVTTRAVTTLVRFRALSEAEIRGYVATGEPMDKAGAYGIQGVGGFLVKSIDGSYSNVVGLPLAELLDELARHGLPAPFSMEAKTS